MTRQREIVVQFLPLAHSCVHPKTQMQHHLRFLHT
uniref:Uncharacterized protein n=1 Tax=Rhizophora mucronata TaxID=61149 RepID=A0A2P2MYT9_RHIMU